MTESDGLYFVPVKVSLQVELCAMLDSGSMACTLGEDAEHKLMAAGALCEIAQIQQA